MKIYPLVVLLCSVATGCMSNPRIDDLSGAERAKAANMPVHNDNPYPTAKVIKTVTGLSCNRNGNQQQDVSQSEALEGIKIQAAMVNADAVVNNLCQKNSDTDWTNNCWASVKCIGDAVKLN
ncbi:hypothetical protein LVQ78_11155 [Buttiauxella sp. A2-C2_NF]|uniref:hypothetical protein n=1 Tax=Buttiauxella ferragutiae TaxID=82989 RepID=UPI001E370C1F|nr:hypothetical protein [Buttiauxella ferragutiae]MCE0826587.1 hypothetical protein [Buttiauxella ferragutiae]